MELTSQQTINVLVLGKVLDTGDFCFLTDEMTRWWEERGQRKYQNIHLVNRAELEPDPFLSTVDFELSWRWEDPRQIFVLITQREGNQIIYNRAKVVWPWGNAPLTAFKRAIRFIHQWSKQSKRVEMPVAVPAFRVQHRAKLLQ